MSEVKKKTFPLHLTEEEHKKLKIAVALTGETMKGFVFSAVMDKVEEVEKNNERKD